MIIYPSLLCRSHSSSQVNFMDSRGFIVRIPDNQHVWVEWSGFPLQALTEIAEECLLHNVKEQESEEPGLLPLTTGVSLFWLSDPLPDSPCLSRGLPAKRSHWPHSGVQPSSQQPPDLAHSPLFRFKETIHCVMRIRVGFVWTDFEVAQLEVDLPQLSLWWDPFLGDIWMQLCETLRRGSS